MADGRSALVFTGYSDTMVYLRDYPRWRLGNGSGIVLRGWWRDLDREYLAIHL